MNDKNAEEIRHPLLLVVFVAILFVAVAVLALRLAQEPDPGRPEPELVSEQSYTWGSFDMIMIEKTYDTPDPDAIPTRAFERNGISFQWIGNRPADDGISTHWVASYLQNSD